MESLMIFTARSYVGSSSWHWCSWLRGPLTPQGESWQLKYTFIFSTTAHGFRACSFVSLPFLLGSICRLLCILVKDFCSASLLLIISLFFFFFLSSKMKHYSFLLLYFGWLFYNWVVTLILSWQKMSVTSTYSAAILDPLQTYIILLTNVSPIHLI